MRHVFDRGLLVLACLISLAPVRAEPLIPGDDDEVVEILPAAVGDRAAERRLRREWAANPRDQERSVALARRYLEQARADGDPRRAGQALAVLQAWSDADRAPDDVLLMIATIEQYLHEFDAAARHLELLVQRQPRQAQAWLTLATVRRVQGRYDASDRACEGVAAAGAWLHARACRAENDGLRGRVEAARAALQGLLAVPRLDATVAGWLATTLAELEDRAGRPQAADADYRRAVSAHRDGYTVISYADFLLARGREADALALLRVEPRTDAVLLRLAIAEVRLRAPAAERDVAELRERMRLAALRPEVRSTHAREQAMLALWLEREPLRATALARENLRHQREPVDLLLLAHCARAAGDARALRDTEHLRQEMDLHDQRLDLLL